MNPLAGQRRMYNPLSGNAWGYQALLDSSPVGSVGAPGGMLPNPTRPQNRDPLQNVLNMAAMMPGIGGDILGPIADARNMLKHPETRTLGNAALFGLGVLPAVPSLMYLMNRGGDAATGFARMAKAKGQSGAVGSANDSLSAAKEFHKKLYGDLQSQIALAKKEDPLADYALRVLPDDMNHSVGEILPESFRWVDGNRTEETLGGTSTIKIRSEKEKDIAEALLNAGLTGDPPNKLPNGAYRGRKVALVKGESIGGGEDVGESIIPDPEVLYIWEKP